MTAVSRVLWNVGTAVKDFGERFERRHPKRRNFTNWVIATGYKIRGKA